VDVHEFARLFERNVQKEIFAEILTQAIYMVVDYQSKGVCEQDPLATIQMVCSHGSHRYTSVQ